MGEEFMYNGKDVLIVFDDLKQAVAYREILYNSLDIVI